MKKKYIFVTAVIILSLTILYTIVYYFVTNRQNLRLVGPMLEQPIPTLTPTPSAPQTPKTFQFDSSTNLKEELEKVNPQVLDSDFDF